MNLFQNLSIILLLTVSSSMHAELIDNFSNIRSENPMNKKSRLQASDKRIVEEIGDPVNLENFSNFAHITSEYLSKLTSRLQSGEKLTENDLKIGVKGVSDLIRAIKKLPEPEQEQASAILYPVEQQLQNSHLKIGRLKTLISDAKSGK